MFENYGCCFAAEQFVDIKLGTKYFLTLTALLCYDIGVKILIFVHINVLKIARAQSTSRLCLPQSVIERVHIC